MTTFEYSPSLTEPGVKFFLGETLKTCRNKKDIFNNKIINICMLGFLVVLCSGLLYYKYKTRPTKAERKKLKQLKRDYFITKVRQLQAKKAKKLGESITNLPKFESPFELLHKNFYKT